MGDLIRHVRPIVGLHKFSQQPTPLMVSSCIRPSPFQIGPHLPLTRSIALSHSTKKRSEHIVTKYTKFQRVDSNPQFLAAKSGVSWQKYQNAQLRLLASPYKDPAFTTTTKNSNLSLVAWDHTMSTPRTIESIKTINAILPVMGKGNNLQKSFSIQNWKRVLKFEFGLAFPVMIWSFSPKNPTLIFPIYIFYCSRWKGRFDFSWDFWRQGGFDFSWDSKKNRG